MEYLLIEIIIFIFLFLSQQYYQVKIFRAKSQFIVFWLWIFVVGILWDQYAVLRGHWYYPGNGTLGIFIGKIPLEDYIFMILVPYAILTAYQISNKIIDSHINKKKTKNFRNHVASQNR